MAPALLTAVDCTNQAHLIIGSNPLAGLRCSRSLEVGAKPKLIAPEASNLHYGLLKRIEAGEVEWIRREFREDDLRTLGRAEVDHVVDAVFVTLEPRNPQSSRISNLCHRLRIPINVADAPALCSFTLLSTHTDGPLQIGITTSGRGCKLASRIRREIASSLPAELGPALNRLGELRERLIQEDRADNVRDDNDDDTRQPPDFNRLINTKEDEAARTRRVRWLSQVCEYWPLKRLASLSDDDIASVLSSAPLRPPGVAGPDSQAQLHPKGRIILAGAGPGSPGLLTTATLSAIQTSEIILADKLVPAPVLELIPRRTTVHIARKFPGNADAAQDELLHLGLAGIRDGKTVLRLKQGDPYLFGRGGEEVLWFRSRGYEPIVLPGVTSALSAPLFATIPVTQRSVADQVLICTGTGRAGQAPPPPDYVESRTVVFLMALHRLSDLVHSLIGRPAAALSADKGPEERAPELGLVAQTQPKPWPPQIPCAIVERASCRDQRVIRSTLDNICVAVAELGSQPPGLLVVGNSCAVLNKMKPGLRWEVEDGGFSLPQELEWPSPVPWNGTV